MNSLGYTYKDHRYVSLNDIDDMKKKILVAINFIALIITGIWAYTSNWDYEPIVGTLILAATLIGLFISESKLFKKNKIIDLIT